MTELSQQDESSSWMTLSIGYRITLAQRLHSILLPHRSSPMAIESRPPYFNICVYQDNSSSRTTMISSGPREWSEIRVDTSHLLARRVEDNVQDKEVSINTMMLWLKS